MNNFQAATQAVSIMGTTGAMALTMFAVFVVLGVITGRAKVKQLQADQAYTDHLNARLKQLREEAGV